MSLLDYANSYHLYIFGTSFWYFLRGLMRLIDPAMVCGWFRPPIDGNPTPNDLELYTTWTDSFGLLSLAAILLVISDAVPLPGTLSGSSLVESTPPSAKKPYARAIVLVTILHHITTGIGAFQHWVKPTHRTAAMDIGVFANVWLVGWGVAALMWGLGDGGEVKGGKRKA